MEHDFWHERWNANQIGFHQGRPNPMLERHAAMLGEPGSGPVLVPLCGKAVDMAWLAGRGWEVVGIEISPVAVRDFFAEQSIPAARASDPPYDVLAGGGVSLLCGDFFAVEGTHVDRVRAVYDRAALVALPAPMRDAYVERLLAVLPVEAPILLITFEYPQDRIDGPPFSIGETEVRRRFDGRRTVEHIESSDVLEEFPYLEARGLDRLTEHAFVLRPV